jgi:uncharacterized protein (DUF697 family)
MTEATINVKKIRRTRKRVYESVEPASVPEVSAEVSEILMRERTLPPLEENIEEVKQPAEVKFDPGADKEKVALTVVRNYTLLSAGVGVLPLPLLDMVTMLALQMLMIRKLAKIYGVPYAEQRVKAAVAGLIGGFDAGYLGYGALKLVPLLGYFSYAAMPTINAGVSYAIGKVFIQHFESGGTFLDFDPKKVRAYFGEQFREGKRKAL